MSSDVLRIGASEPAASVAAAHGGTPSGAWTHRAAVSLDYELLGWAWRLPDGQWTTWERGPRFATAQEAAEHLLAWHRRVADCDPTESTESICQELRAAGLDPERMQRRVRELLERVRAERQQALGGASPSGPLSGAEVTR